MARKTREETENTRAQILQSALDCFYEKGFSRTTFEDIAARINLTKGAVYWHFKNKAELLADLINRQAEKNRLEIGSRYTRPDSIAALRDFFRREAEYIERSPEVRKFIFFTLFQVEWSDSIFNQVDAKTGEIRDFHFKTITNALTNAQKNGEISPKADIRTAGIVMVGTWRGLINAYICKDLKFSLSQTFLEGFDAIIDRIGNNERLGK